MKSTWLELTEEMLEILNDEIEGDKPSCERWIKKMAFRLDVMQPEFQGLIKALEQIERSDQPADILKSIASTALIKMMGGVN